MKRLALLCTLAAVVSCLAAAQENVAIHIVRPGDTLPRLCWQYKVRLDALQAANPVAADPLAAGQRLVIPLGPMLPASAPDQASQVRTALAAPADPPPRPTRVALTTALPPPPAPAAVPSREESAPPSPPPSSVPPRGDFLDEARRLAEQRVAYNGRWVPPGRAEAWTMDCSNTARYLYLAVTGLDIGRTASDQYYFLRQKGRAWDVPQGWDHRPRLDYLRAHLQPGDLLFWENTYKPVRTPDITHVMVFLGADAAGRWQMAGSQASQGVSIYRFDPQATKGGYSAWFGLVHHEGRFVAYGRLLGEG